MEEKRLYRSRKNQVIAGVCSGLGEYFGIDPTILRIIFVILTLWGGVGLVVYLVMAILIPYSPDENHKAVNPKMEINTKDIGDKIKSAASEVKQRISQEDIRENKKGNHILGLIILLLGLMLLARNLFPWFRLDILWPALLIILGILLIASERRK